MTIMVYVPRDAASLSLGAERVAQAVKKMASARGLDLRIARNGSRGMIWLEPLVEVVTLGGRVGYGPVQVADVEDLFEAGFLDGREHRLRVGQVEHVEWLASQQRLTFERVGVIDPLSIAEYVQHGGYAGLRRALDMVPADIVQTVIDSGLRGRGGAGFPTGVKWKTVLEQGTAPKYVTCNADEGDSGTFADRMLMEGDPFCLIEGMTIAGVAVGATRGYIYLREEYPHAHRMLNQAIALAYASGHLGSDVLGSGQRFELEVRLGGGAYICGEETSMLESLEGKRGEVRVRPPLPAIKGLFGQPTVVNNVISLASVPGILAKGAEHYAGFGQGKSRGTMPLQLAGNVRRGGLIERGFGLTLRELVYDYGGGSASGRPVRAVQVGGPLGAYIPESQFDTRVDYESLADIGALLGHGGVVVFDDTVDMAGMARYALQFCALESCGKCTPCRIGSIRGVELMDRVIAGVDRERNLALIDELCETLLHGSLCGLGGMTPYPVRSALRHFPGDFRRTVGAAG